MSKGQISLVYMIIFLFVLIIFGTLMQVSNKVYDVSEIKFKDVNKSIEKNYRKVNNSLMYSVIDSFKPESNVTINNYDLTSRKHYGG